MIKVVGPRVLVKVKKIKEQDIEKIEGSMLYRANVDKSTAQQETRAQTIGEVVQLGSTAYKRKDAFCDGTPYVSVGDSVHFSRYGAMCIKTDDEEYEYWVLMDKDVLVVDNKEEVKENAI